MNQYVNVPKSVLSDTNLSLRAKGLYALMLSLPSYWNGSVRYFVEASGMSKHIVWNTVKELEKNGYLERHQMIDENGCFSGMEYVLKEGPNNGTT